MKFIIDTHNLEVSKSMIETLLENEFDNPISVKEIEEINEEELDKLAEKYENEVYGYSVDLENDLETDCSNQQNIIDIHDTFKAGCKEILKKLS